MIDTNDIRFSKVLGESKPSDAQIRIVDFVTHGIGNAVIQSRAGSGKSKTIELAATFIPANKKVLVVSYNRHIAQHLRSKFAEMNNIDVRTYHSLGHKILCTKFKDFKNGKLMDMKYKDYISHNIIELSNGQWNWWDGVQRWCYKKNIERLVDYARYNKAQSAKEIQKIANKYGITSIIANEYEAVKAVLRWGSEHIDTFDYLDLIWLPYELNIPANMMSLQYDYIFIDEAQDSSLIQQNLLNVCKKRNTRFFAFGDSKQTINSWCGSDTDAFNNFLKQSNTRKFNLNVSYRCSKRVREEVQKLVPDFDVPSNAPEGAVNHSAKTSDIKAGDLVLSRMTSPLVQLHMKLLKENKPSRICGLKLSSELIKTIQDTGEETMEGVMKVLYKGLIKNWETLQTQYDCSLRDVVSEPILVEAYDEIQSLLAVSEGLTTKDEVIERIKSIFSDSTAAEGEITDVLDDEHIHLSTVHRAKGLEADNVFILCPSEMPSKLAEADWEKESEQNIIYVAWSRARLTLNFLDERENRPPKSFGGVSEFYNELIEIKNKYERESH